MISAKAQTIEKAEIYLDNLKSLVPEENLSFYDVLKKCFKVIFPKKQDYTVSFEILNLRIYYLLWEICCIKNNSRLVIMQDISWFFFSYASYYKEKEFFDPIWQVYKYFVTITMSESNTKMRYIYCHYLYNFWFRYNASDLTKNLDPKTGQHIDYIAPSSWPVFFERLRIETDLLDKLIEYGEKQSNIREDWRECMELATFFYAKGKIAEAIGYAEKSVSLLSKRILNSKEDMWYKHILFLMHLYRETDMLDKYYQVFNNLYSRMREDAIYERISLRDNICDTMFSIITLFATEKIYLEEEYFDFLINGDFSLEDADKMGSETNKPDIDSFDIFNSESGFDNSAIENNECADSNLKTNCEIVESFKRSVYERISSISDDKKREKINELVAGMD